MDVLDPLTANFFDTVFGNTTKSESATHQRDSIAKIEQSGLGVFVNF